MENASKALLIAGAILIAIVLISLGVMILGQGSDLVKNANMSDAEISTYNSEWEQYRGGNVRGNMIIQMINKVNQHNRATDDTSKKIGVLTGEKTDDKAEDYNSTDNLTAGKVKSGYSYKVTIAYNSGGLVSNIHVKENK